MNNIRVKQESLSNWRGEVTSEGLASKLIKIGAGAFIANKAGKWLKKKGDAALDDARKNMKIGGDKRKSDIENATGVKLEHIEGGISVQNVADGLNFTEIETVDIIKPEPIKGSSNIEEGAGRIIKQIIKSPGVKKFVSNLSKSSKIKSISPKLVTTPGSTLGSGGKFAANHFDKVPTGAGSSYVPKHVKYLDSMVDKSKRGLTGTAGAKGFATPDSKSVKVYKQPSYANPKYPGDKTGAYARELARQDNTARIGKNSAINKDGISNKGYYSPDGTNTVGGKVKLKKINDSYNWKLEMITEMLISEGYTDDEIVTIITEGSERDLGWASLLAGGIKNTLWAGKKVYDAGRGTRSIVNRAVKDSKLTKDIFSTAKKLRNPDGISVTKSPRVDTPSKGGRLVKSFKGFMQNVKDAGSNLANRTKGKLDRINAKKAEIQTTAKDVDVLGGAASKTGSTSKLKNITPKSVKATEVLKGVGDRVKNATDKIKVVGAGTAGATLGAATGLKDKVATGLKAPITNDGKKTVDPSKNEKIES